MKIKNKKWKWVIDETFGTESDVDGRYCPTDLKDEKGNTVAHGGQCQWEGSIIFYDKKDADLIAAAPEMLRLLREIEEKRYYVDYNKMLKLLKRFKKYQL